MYWLLYYTNTCIIYHYSTVYPLLYTHVSSTTTLPSTHYCTHMYHLPLLYRLPTTVHTCTIYPLLYNLPTTVHTCIIYPLMYRLPTTVHTCTIYPLLYTHVSSIPTTLPSTHYSTHMYHLPTNVSAHIHATENACYNDNTILGSVMPYQNYSCNLQFIRLFHSYS